ncbi:DUF541 domain-containing protein [Lutibacter sp. HS1-25]|uniref:SIMPL domain-containing protein n=1 Tax=Lutibacter sp. HS1-25 TaxID=2485000 RepID=UPI001011FABD|nr:SIMPL domain-containing protein [Lutibacter sp. HS1-25]RXP63294.1 DUF541 domain-containing protein [Lutibacter sp. HS1-25]
MKKKCTLIIAILLMVNFGFSQTKNFIDQPYLETSASVDTLVTADKIYLKILINESDTKDKISVEELENKMEIALKDLGIDTSKNLALIDLASNFKNYFLKQKDVMKSKAYSLLVFDAQTAGKVIIALENLNISNVELEKLEHSNIEDVKLILKSKAILKAKRQADYLTKPLNQKTGTALQISDNVNQGYQYNRNQLDEMVVVGYSARKKQEFEPIDIEFKKIKVETEVVVKFKID